MKTKAEMIEEYGAVPLVSSTWTIHRAHASVTWVTSDGGDTWEKKHVIWADERARRELAAAEQADIQRNLK